jgi:hypothetical protein
MSRPQEATSQQRTGTGEETTEHALGLRQHGELALEGLAGPPQQGLDGPDLDPFVIGDLLVGPSRSLSHGQHMAMADGKSAEGPVDQFAIDSSQDELFGSLVGASTDVLMRAEFQIVGGRAPRPTAQHVRADVAGDHRQPGVEAPLAGTIGKGLPCSCESLLRCVLCLVAIVEPPQAEAKQPLVVARVQVAEGSRISRLAPLHQDPVAIEINVVAQAGELFL